MDKRSGERMAILGQLQGEIMVFQPMVVVEVSRTGATVDTRFPLQVDSLHDLRLTLPTGPVVVKARIAHSHISDVDQEIVTYRSGMEFIEPTEHAKAAVAEFIEQIKSIRST